MACPDRSGARAALVRILALTCLGVAPAWSQSNTVSGDFWVEPPTLRSLGFEWRIGGDDNRNASVEVSYRKTGEQQWHKALPLLRLQRESVTGIVPRDGSGEHFNRYVAPNMFAGSILNLEPDTEYDCRLVLADPDGVKGKKEQIVRVHTRKEPVPASGGAVYHVYPFGYQGSKQQPAFTGLLAAYYLGSDQSDHSREMPPRVRPGDTILVHAGVYKDNRFVYSGFDKTLAAYGTPFDGTYYLTQSGTPDKPIVIKGAGDGEAIFDGDGCDNLFNLMGGNYNYFEGITVRNTQVAFKLGIKYIAGSSGFTLKRSRVYDVGRAVEAGWSGSKDFYIADNVFIGRHDPNKMQSWFTPEVWAKFPGFPALIHSEYAVKVYGQGHVVAHNYVANWHDGIDVDTYGDPDGTPNELRDRVPVAIDINNNDIYNTDDNCIEADGGAHNIRVFQNRCFNSTGGALSAQPTFGGPLYFYQNVAYGLTTGGYMKLVDTPAGVLFYQNTFVGQVRYFGPAANVHFRNNLILSDGWSPEVFALRTTTNYSTSDYNGFRLNPAGEDAFEWDSPAPTAAADFTHPLEVRKFKTLAEYAAVTGKDKHSLQVDFDTFVKVALPDKSDPQRLYNPEDFDFRLKDGSPAIDAGVELPTITDGFSGKAPDLGAYELGIPVPHYGPRSQPPGVVAADAPRSIKGPPAGEGAARAPVAHLRAGTVSGMQTGDVAAFLGIPFAAPPVGPDRWRAPRPAVAWKGTRDASHFAASCYQALTPDGFGPWKHEFVVQGEVSEDCLYLNVWTPKADARARLPVLVWVHGGGFNQGSGSVAVYDGRSRAADGIVVVNFNYRMGAFGFLAHPELTREAGKNEPPGNYGLQDMVAALRWVRANIAALGGDPNQVTIAGQSAGAMAIHDLLVSPLAKGLFQRAIIESGLPNIAPPTSLAAAAQAGEDFAHAKNAASLAALRALPPADLMGPSKLPGGRFGPIVDGVLLPDAATKLAADGKSYDMPVLIGMVADENSALSPSYATADEATRLQMRERGLAALYAWGSERVAHSQQPVFVYLFTHTEPGPDSARYRAFHSAELPYVFGTLDKSPERNFTDADRGLAHTVASYWVNFVKTGDPNGQGLSSWPRFASGDPQIMKLDVESAAQPVLPEQKLRAVRDDLAHGGHPSIF